MTAAAHRNNEQTTNVAVRGTHLIVRQSESREIGEVGNVGRDGSDRVVVQPKLLKRGVWAMEIRERTRGAVSSPSVLSA